MSWYGILSINFIVLLNVLCSWAPSFKICFLLYLVVILNLDMLWANILVICWKWPVSFHWVLLQIKFLNTSFCLLPLRESHLMWLQIIVSIFSASLIPCACVMAPAGVAGTCPVAAEFWQRPAGGVAWSSLGQLECNQAAGVSWTDPISLHGTACLNRDIHFHKMFFFNNLKPRVSCQVGLAVGCFSYPW